MRASYIDTVIRWLRTSVQQNGAVQGEATLESLRRFRIFAVVTLLVNVAYTAEFWWHLSGQESAIRARWANAIGWTHFSMGMAMVVLGLLIHRMYRTSTRSSYQAIVLQALFSVCCLGFAIALSVIDQWVTTNTTNFAMISLLIGMLSLMRPGAALLAYGLAYAVFFQALSLTQSDPASLALARSHALGAVLMSFVASVVVWRQYVAGVVLRREITTAHAELAQKQIALEFLATHDALTGMYNRREFMRLAEMESARIARHPADLSLLMIDLDFFKRINDQYGHPTGDEVLQQVATILTAGVRTTDIVARLGGEEFIVLLPNTAQDGAMAVAEKLRNALRAQPLQIQGRLVPVTASFGVSGLAKAEQGSIDGLYAAADHAMYVAKQLGRDRAEYAAPAL